MRHMDRFIFGTHLSMTLFFVLVCSIAWLVLPSKFLAALARTSLDGPPTRTSSRPVRRVPLRLCEDALSEPMRPSFFECGGARHGPADESNAGIR